MTDYEGHEVASLGRYFDIRRPDEYITTEPPRRNMEAIRQRYAFSLEFISQQMTCAHCGTKYRPYQNFARFGCRMHPGPILYTKDTNEPYHSCCGRMGRLLDTGCTPCIHSRLLYDFETKVLAMDGYKHLPVEMVDLLNAFPVNRDFIVGSTSDGKKYLFATSELQRLREANSVFPVKEKAYNSDLEEDDDYDEGLSDDPVEEELFEVFESSRIVASDNWKIKMLMT